MSFCVTIHATDRKFTVEAGESILDAALRQGVALPYGCRDGACGSCRGKILTGRIHYPHDPPLGWNTRDANGGEALFCQARPDSDLIIAANEIEAASQLPLRRLPCRVAGMERLTHDVMRLRLTLPPTERLQFLAGQYVNVLLKDGRRRGFSIANAPEDDAFIELHVRHVPGGTFTDYVFNMMKPRAMLRIEGPLGGFYLREDSRRPVILLGGGTGFAPLKGMLEHAFYLNDRRAMHLFWGVRSRRDLYQQDLIEDWLRQHARFQYTPVLSEPSANDRWQGETGLVSEVMLRHYPDLLRHDVYMAGPPAMIEAARGDLLRHALPEKRLFSDAFEFGADRRKATAQAALPTA
jgi:CDP-4-dehydro-6-deoxyglucose reductase